MQRDISIFSTHNIRTSFPSMLKRHLAGCHNPSLSLALSNSWPIVSPHTYMARSTLSPLGYTNTRFCNDKFHWYLWSIINHSKLLDRSLKICMQNFLEGTVSDWPVPENRVSLSLIFLHYFCFGQGKNICVFRCSVVGNFFYTCIFFAVNYERHKNLNLMAGGVGNA